MLAAIEIYNKPKIEYRDELVVILMLNAWELALKAVVSKSGKSIYYPKERKEPYRMLVKPASLIPIVCRASPGVGDRNRAALTSHQVGAQYGARS